MPIDILIPKSTDVGFNYKRYMPLPINFGNNIYHTWGDERIAEVKPSLNRKASNFLKIRILENNFVTIPKVLYKLASEIEHSKSILKLKDNWDEEGAKGYKKQTYLQAINFLVRFAKWVKEECSTVIDTPKILPANNGCISLYWKRLNYDLLITIPEYPNTVATFYGDDKGKTKIEGEFPLENHERGVFLCLLEKK